MERIEIINNLKRDGAWYRFNGIIYASVENLADEEIFKLLRYLKDDQVQMAGRPIGWYAIAALDMFGAEKYTGSDPDIVRFVSEYPDIVQGIQEAERKKNLLHPFFGKSTQGINDKLPGGDAQVNPPCITNRALLTNLSRAGE